LGFSFEYRISVPLEDFCNNGSLGIFALLVSLVLYSSITSSRWSSSSWLEFSDGRAYAIWGNSKGFLLSSVYFSCSGVYGD
jgi:hypothetical protein